jgi:hypothetical protein
MKKEKKMSNAIVKIILKKVVKIVYLDALYPMAKKFVESTENPYDDQFLKALDAFVKGLIEKL